jgi:2-polyprenyl-6-methoxyphenol hydroxylase-like FAD-dependent oxidoreductase
MTALQARLSGMRVTVWERRSLQERTRDNVVDASESDRNDPQHPAALTLFENIGLLYLGMSGMNFF